MNRYLEKEWRRGERGRERERKGAEGKKKRKKKLPSKLLHLSLAHLGQEQINTAS